MVGVQIPWYKTLKQATVTAMTKYIVYYTKIVWQANWSNYFLLKIELYDD